jgi:hypothetical protein
MLSARLGGTDSSVLTEAIRKIEIARNGTSCVCKIVQYMLPPAICHPEPKPTIPISIM